MNAEPSKTSREVVHQLFEATKKGTFYLLAAWVESAIVLRCPAQPEPPPVMFATTASAARSQSVIR